MTQSVSSLPGMTHRDNNNVKPSFCCHCQQNVNVITIYLLSYKELGASLILGFGIERCVPYLLGRIFFSNLMSFIGSEDLK